MTPEELYNRNIKLAMYFAKRWFPSFPEWLRDDVLAEARLGLWIACRTFDHSRGCRFSTYAGRVIMNRINMMYRDFRRGNPPEEVSLNAPVVSGRDKDRSKDPELSEIIAVEVDYIGHVEAALIRERLTPLLRRVAAGQSQYEIARELGISQAQVCRRIRKERLQLKKVLGYL